MRKLIKNLTADYTDHTDFFCFICDICVICGYSFVFKGSFPAITLESKKNNS